MKLKTAKDNEAKDHELHCWTHDIPFSHRTLWSCNCSKKHEFKANFEGNRKKKSKG